MPSIQKISIHAPREGGDGVTLSCPLRTSNFNPRPPRGGRLCRVWRYLLSCDFNPRPPRGGRRACILYTALTVHFNPRPPRGGRRHPRDVFPGGCGISIHAPREGGDSWRSVLKIFERRISIHAPREGGDPGHFHQRYRHSNFNPRPPRGGRQQRCTVLPADL